jgi:hypothetical protein
VSCFEAEKSFTQRLMYQKEMGERNYFTAPTPLLLPSLLLPPIPLLLPILPLLPFSIPPKSL